MPRPSGLKGVISLWPEFTYVKIAVTPGICLLALPSLRFVLRVRVPTLIHPVGEEVMVRERVGKEAEVLAEEENNQTIIFLRRGEYGTKRKS
jgi:hypothetical protein